RRHQTSPVLPKPLRSSTPPCTSGATVVAADGARTLHQGMGTVAVASRRGGITRLAVRVEMHTGPVVILPKPLRDAAVMRTGALMVRRVRVRAVLALCRRSCGARSGFLLHPALRRTGVRRDGPGGLGRVRGWRRGC